MYQPAVDLFGEVPVLESDLENWVAAVAPVYLSSERSFQSYLKSYDVPAKVRRAKLRGEFDQITATKRVPYHARLALNAIL
jgi:hypothetical protein